MGGKPSTYDPETGTKVCPRCQTRKPVAEFAANRTKRLAYSSYCKWCDADRMRAVRDKRRKQRKRRAWMGRPPNPRPGSQRCLSCGIQKPFSEFHRDRDRASGHSVYCKPCACAKTREWYAADPGRARDLTRRRLFGLKPGEYTVMVASQNGLCACCGEEPGQKGLQVDHCHRTGRVRSLLCGPCNLGLGSFKDDPERLRKAISYLTMGVS
jgi:hypothetical protein